MGSPAGTFPEGFITAELAPHSPTTVQQQYAEAIWALAYPETYGHGARRYVRTFPGYPEFVTREEVAFGTDAAYPLPEPEFEVEIPKAFGELHHRAPEYETVTVSQAVRSGNATKPPRMNSWRAFLGITALGGIITAGMVSCGESVKSSSDSLIRLQRDYQHMTAHDSEEPVPRANPLLPPWPLPSLGTDAPWEVAPLQPTPSSDAALAASPLAERQLACVKAWSLERQIGQLISVPLKGDGSYKLRPQATLRATEQVMRTQHVGGIVLTEGTPEQTAAIIKEYSLAGNFEAPLLIADVRTNAWYGLDKPGLTTSADMGGPVVPGDKQRTIAEVFGDELKNGVNAPVFLQDVAHAHMAPLTLTQQVHAMVREGVTRVYTHEISTDALAKAVVLNFVARGADTCDVNTNN